MSDSSNIKLPGGYGVLTSAFNLMRASIDVSDKTTPKDRVLAFKSPILDFVGGVSGYFKSCSTLSKAMPFVGKIASINDGRIAWNNLQAERSGQQPDQARIRQFQRDLFVASADTISPILPIGTVISTTVDIGTYMVKNPQLFTDRPPMAVAEYREYVLNSQ